jgi:aminoglycoside 6'-N-acetyltransferase I
MTIVRPVTIEDAEAWLRLRCDLWPDGSEAEHRAEIEQFFLGQSREPMAVLAASESETVLGFVELSIRPCAEGCRTSSVAYLEGWYVAPEARRRKVGRLLIEGAERWAREQGCTEFASDAHPDNEASIRAHHAAGFEDAGLIRCFRKSL